MSRSGYSDDLDNWAMIKWRGAVNSATKGQRGQKFFRDLVAALEAMPEKRLITDELESHGSFCALGALGQARGVDMAKLDTEDRQALGKAFDIAPALAAEVMFENDECSAWDQPDETPKVRYWRMYFWAQRQIKKTEQADPA